VRPASLLFNLERLKQTFINRIESGGEPLRVALASFFWTTARPVVGGSGPLANEKTPPGSAGLRGLQGLFSRLLIPRQDSFLVVRGTHLGRPDKQKAPETLGCRGFLKMGSGRYRTQ
jgi:hypothetical protein